MNYKLNQNQDWLELAREVNWSVSKLAKRCNISLRTLERHILKTKGKTPKAWLAEYRKKQAIDFLDDGLSVKETASLVGYRHASTFAREFKKTSGQCPNDLVLIRENKPIQPRNVA